MEYDNSNSGVAFFNDKRSNDKQPDWRGTGNYNGVEFELALWERTSKNGKKFYSIKFSEPYQKSDGGNWAKAREKFAKPEVLPTDAEVDAPIDLSEIPF